MPSVGGGNEFHTTRCAGNVSICNRCASYTGSPFQQASPVHRLEDSDSIAAGKSV